MKLLKTVLILSVAAAFWAWVNYATKHKYDTIFTIVLPFISGVFLAIWIDPFNQKTKKR